MSSHKNIQQLQLEALLKEKQNLFDKKIKENKEFGELKILFQEIRAVERTLNHLHQTINTVDNQIASR